MLSFNFEFVIFDHRVAQKPVAGFIESASRRFHVSAVQFDFQIFAHVNGIDAAIAHVLKRVLDGFPLRINDGFLWSNDDFGFHVKTARNFRDDVGENGGCKLVFFTERGRSGERLETAPQTGGSEAGICLARFERRFPTWCIIDFQSAEPSPVPRLWRRRSVRGLETRDTQIWKSRYGRGRHAKQLRKPLELARWKRALRSAAFPAAGSRSFQARVPLGLTGNLLLKRRQAPLTSAS